MTPMRKQRFTGEQMKKPEDVARQINAITDQLHDATLPSRSNGRNSAITFEGISIDGTLPDPNVKLQHNFGAKVRWSLVRWVQLPSGVITGAELYEPFPVPSQQGGQQDPNVLLLRPAGSVIGIADIEVWIAS